MKNSLQRPRDDSFQHSRVSGGFTFMEFICVLGVISVLVVMALPSLRTRGGRAQRINCINNLKQISLACKQWALDNNDLYPAQVSVTNGGAMEACAKGEFWVNFLVMSNELNTPKVLVCPKESHPQRRAATTWLTVATSLPVGQVPFTNGLSYFLGLEANESAGDPQRILLGDANLDLDGKRVEAGTLVVRSNSNLSWPKPYRADHGKGGNIALLDGSASSMRDSELRAQVRRTVVTNLTWGMP